MNSTNPAEFEAYLAQFPNGVFSALAQARLAALGAPANGSPGQIHKRRLAKPRRDPVLVVLQELIEALHEPGHGHRVGLADAVDIGADQDQAAGAALAVGGGDAPMR